MHTSIKLTTPCEFIKVEPLNPLISKCQIKVCYVGEQPNRNKSIITNKITRTHIAKGKASFMGLEFVCKTIMRAHRDDFGSYMFLQS